MIRRPPRSTLDRSSAASDVYKRQGIRILEFSQIVAGPFAGVALSDMVADIIKVERSFVRGIVGNPHDRAIVEAVIRISHDLGRVVVAEGVETFADWTFLTRTGCHVAQGFFIARPMPTEELPNWLMAWDDRVLRELSNPIEAEAE